MSLGEETNEEWANRDSRHFEKSSPWQIKLKWEGAGKYYNTLNHTYSLRGRKEYIYYIDCVWDPCREIRSGKNGWLVKWDIVTSHLFFKRDLYFIYLFIGKWLESAHYKANFKSLSYWSASELHNHKREIQGKCICTRDK